MFGVLKVVLSFVVRDDPTLPVLLTPLHPNLICSLEKSSMMGELVAYTPNTVPSYKSDNVQVYNLLAKSLSGNNAMTSIERHHQRRDGRLAYLDPITHKAKWEKTVEKAQSVLETKGLEQTQFHIPA